MTYIVIYITTYNLIFSCLLFKMEKLIELLNEYCWEDEWSETKWTKKHLLEWWLLSLQVISKKFWFIKWLVENEKIEWDEKFYLEDDEWLFGTYECILMQLAIQDEPIEFLVSILK